MKKQPSHYVIQENGDWHYFVKGKQVDIYDYRRAVEVFEHQVRNEREKARDERLAQPKGAYITKQFRTIYNKQLATSQQAYNRRDPSCGYNNFRELEIKAKATGQAVNVSRDHGE